MLKNAAGGVGHTERCVSTGAQSTTEEEEEEEEEELVWDNWELSSCQQRQFQYLYDSGRFENAAGGVGHIERYIAKGAQSTTEEEEEEEELTKTFIVIIIIIGNSSSSGITRRCPLVNSVNADTCMIQE